MRTAVALLLLAAFVRAEPPKYAEIRVVDADTKRGVPLVELTTVNHVRYVTDNAGRVAFDAPEPFGREVFLSVKSHGYEVPKDGFGFRGVKITPTIGKVVEIEVRRAMVAERLCRLTGEGRYRDTLVLGYESPIDYGPNPGRVAGQDSVQVVEYKGERRWFWGDTNRTNYPLGMFRTAGAKTPLKRPDPAAGIAFDYFTDKTGFARALMPLALRPEGVIWIDGVCVVPDEKGKETLVAHYSRRKGLAEQLEHGLAVYDDATDTFVPKVELAKGETWRFPSGHPFAFEEDGKKWLLCGDPAPVVRVPATLAAVLDPKQYEAFARVKAEWRWQTALPPLDAIAEAELVRAKAIRAEDARFTPTGDGTAVTLHRGTVRWNAYRKRWVLIATQQGGKSSHLGEVWYAEADHPTGPFRTAVKVLTHDQMSFYNPVHHPFLDADGGRTIHFEGTYTADFSSAKEKTPRYEYNQMLYRLDLDAPALKAARK